MKKTPSESQKKNTEYLYFNDLKITKRNIKATREYEIQSKVFSLYVTHCLSGASAIERECDFSKIKEHRKKYLSQILSMFEIEPCCIFQYRSYDNMGSAKKSALKCVEEKNPCLFLRGPQKTIKEILREIRNSLCHGNYILKNGLILFSEKKNNNNKSNQTQSFIKFLLYVKIF